MHEICIYTNTFTKQNKLLRRRYWGRTVTACVYDPHAQFQLLLPFSESIPLPFEYPTALRLSLVLCGLLLEESLHSSLGLLSS